MTTPPGPTGSAPDLDAQLVARLAQQFAWLSGQLGRIGQDLAVLQAQLARPPAPAPPPMWQPAPYQPGYVPAPYPPMAYQRPPSSQVPPPRATAPRAPWWQRDGVISRVLAVAGAGVTLIGIVMLLVLVAKAGFFGPVLRVGAGAVLSSGLLVSGARIVHRSGGRVGGLALATTGLAGMYLDVVAVTSAYHWVAAPVGLAVALGVTAGGLAIAVRWESQPLASMVVIGVAALAPIVTGSLTLTLVGFLLVLQASCVPVQVIRDWPFLHVARTVPVVLVLLASVAAAALDVTTLDRRWMLAAVVTAAAVGIASALIASYRTPADVTAGVMLAVANLPVLLSTDIYARRTDVLVQGMLSVLLLLVAAWPRVAAHARVVCVASASVALVQACFFLTGHDTFDIALFAVAAGFLAVAGRSRAAYVAGLGFGVVGGMAYLTTVSPDALADPRRAVDMLGASGIVSSGLAAAVIVLLVLQAHRLGLLDAPVARPAWVIGGLGCLYAVTAAVVGVGVAAGGTSGFLAGHSVATITWMVAATALLLRGLRGSVHVRLTLGAGLLLTAAAVAKLFLFDLATLDGLLRVSAFIAVGLLLLVAGTRYARAFAERTGETPHVMA